MDKHRIIHIINILLILLLLLLLFYGRGGREDGQEFPWSQSEEGALLERSRFQLDGRSNIKVPALYPSDKQIALNPSTQFFPWVFSIPGTAPKRPQPTPPPPQTEELSLEEQEALFYELSFTEWKAVQDATHLDPKRGKKYFDYVNQWSRIYREAVREKFHINQQQLEEIYFKGIAERWPIYGS